MNLLKGRERVRQAYIELDSSNAEKPIIDISVSFDGTWHRRGHISNYGVGVVIEIFTGLLIDYCVLSKYCHECAITKKGLGEDSPEFHI